MQKNYNFVKKYFQKKIFISEKTYFFFGKIFNGKILGFLYKIAHFFGQN